MTQIKSPMEVTNKFKGLALIEYLKNYGRRLVTLLVTEAGIKTIHKKKKCKKAIWLSEEALQIAEKRSERQRRKGKKYHLNAEFQRIARRDKKAFLSDQ